MRSEYDINNYFSIQATDTDMIKLLVKVGFVEEYAKELQKLGKLEETYKKIKTLEELKK